MIKFIIVVSSFIFLVGCNPPVLMNAETKEIAAKCFDRGFVPYYFSNGSVIRLECIPVDNRE
jgi:hypothetical protein